MQACEPWCQPHMRDARFPGRLLATILAGSSGSWRKARSTFGVGHMKHFQVRWIVRMGTQGDSLLLVRVVPRPSLNSEGVNARRCIAGSQLAHPPSPSPLPSSPRAGRVVPGRAGRPPPRRIPHAAGPAGPPPPPAPGPRGMECRSGRRCRAASVACDRDAALRHSRSRLASGDAPTSACARARAPQCTKRRRKHTRARAD